jgi:hypothetical protein
MKPEHPTHHAVKQDEAMPGFEHLPLIMSVCVSTISTIVAKLIVSKRFVVLW